MPVEIRPERQLRGDQPVAAPVAREEHDLAVAEAADAVGVGRIAEGRPHPVPADVGEPLQLVEPTASDDADSRLTHR